MPEGDAPRPDDLVGAPSARLHAQEDERDVAVREDEERTATDQRGELWAEYKIVQGKIDKIAEFHFRVRTWAITITGAIAIGGIAKDFPWFAFIAALPAIFAFYMVDRAQTHWQHALERRADQIEKRLRTGTVGPRLVQVLRNEQKLLTSTRRGKVVAAHGGVFYLTMCGLALGALVVSLIRPRHAEDKPSPSQTPGVSPAAPERRSAGAKEAQSPTFVRPQPPAASGDKPGSSPTAPPAVSQPDVPQRDGAEDAQGTSASKDDSAVNGAQPAKSRGQDKHPATAPIPPGANGKTQ